MFLTLGCQKHFAFHLFPTSLTSSLRPRFLLSIIPLTIACLIGAGPGGLDGAVASAMQEVRALRMTLQQKDSEIELLKSMMGAAESGVNEQAQSQIQLLEQTLAAKDNDIAQLQQVPSIAEFTSAPYS